MTNSQVKKAIDETIGQKPLMNEAFVQKVMDGKKKRKKPLPFFQPALVAVLMLLIGAVLYFTPQETKQAVEINEAYLTDSEEQLIGQYYAAIAQQDEKTLKKIAITNAEEAFFRYSSFDLAGPLQVLRTIDETYSTTVLLRLPRPDGEELIDTLVINKQTNKVEVDARQTMKYYVDNVELPKEFAFTYRDAPLAPIIKNEKVNVKNAMMQTLSGHTLYQIQQAEGVRRVLETPNGQMLDLGIASTGTTYFHDGGDGRFYFIDSETMNMVFIYRNEGADYQIVSGQLKYPGVTMYKTDFIEEHVVLLGGHEPKSIIIENGQLHYANIFEQVELYNSPLLYRTEAVGANLLVIYQEDDKQLSSYYQFTAKELLMNSSKVDMLEAKPEHFKDLWLQNRYKDQYIYIFNDGMLHTRERENAAMDVVEKTYTNIQIETKDDQYFITGDNGFSWTLTRTAPRILQDEKGIEYTVPIAFEELKEMRQDVLEDDVRSLRLYEQGGSGMNAYVLEEDLPRVNELFTEATPNKELITLENTDLKIEIEYNNGKKVTFDLWLREGESIIRNPYPLDDMYSMFRIPNALADEFRQLLQRLEEIDNK
ncbi:MAG: hypothetical protein ABS942_14675 [Solibacillus sp.]|uniref:hypothetical protein n=1 Tax=Solibacillus sp. TaxID=1909654 RepID=UPI00331513D5